MQKAFRIGPACFLFLVAVTCARGQMTRPPAPERTFATTAVAGAPGGGAAPPAPSNLTLAGGSNREIDLSWKAPADSSSVVGYKIYSCLTVLCAAPTPVGTISSINSYSVTKLQLSANYYLYVVSVNASNVESVPSNILSVRTGTSKFTSELGCWLIPARRGCMDFGLPNMDAHTRIYSNVNAFYQTSGSYSFFNQIKSIYNGASSSATVSADLATLNFPNAMQVTVATNVQAGSSGTTTASTGIVPTLSPSGAGQATQNIIYGGTFVVSEVYPLFATGASRWGSAGGVGVIIDAIAREGADVQNFKSGTNVNVTSPPFHGSGQIEGYLQSNSINLAPNSQHFAGSVFVGGSYGYNYMSHVYARDYGFGTQVKNGIGQVSLGILINGVANITVSRAFGPSQTYIDSTTMAQTNVNNFKAWSFGVAYQSAPASK